MGCYAVGSECCNNCIHWDCRTERQFRGNPPKEVYTASNCDKCSLTGRNTLSKNTCGMFKHIGGITCTFAVEEKHASGDYVSNIIDSLDETSRAYLQSLVDYTRSNSGQVQSSENQRCKVEREAEQEEDEDNFDGEAELEFARTMKEYGRADERLRELFDAGLHPSTNSDQRVEFMHMLDRARGGDARAQLAFSRALREGTHGAGGIKFLGTQQGYLIAEWCKAAAEQGLAAAQYDMGHYSYYCGEEGQVEWLRKAAAQGHSKAKAELEELTNKLAGKAKDRLSKCLRMLMDEVHVNKEKNAIKYIEEASSSLEHSWHSLSLYELDRQFVDVFMHVVSNVAQNDMPELQNVIGKMYAYYPSYKRIVGQNYSNAVHWFESAAGQGNLDAMDNLGNCYAAGNGVGKDCATAVEWYRRAAEGGLDWGQYHYACKLLAGEGIAKNIDEGRKWLHKAAEQGLKEAEKKIKDVDAPRLVEEYKKMAEQGDAHGMSMLGECYYCGRGITEDTLAAVKWFKRGMAQGDANSIFWMGVCYDRGDGVEKNGKESFTLFHKAAEKGHVLAQYRLAGCYYSGCENVVEADSHEAFKWYYRAAVGGSADAQWRVGCMIEEGRGTDKDKELGKAWQERAKANGYDPHW